MKAPVLERTSAGKAGWLILLILFAWLAFVFVPLPWKEAPPMPAATRAPPSKLRQAGLRDYTDWQGLPEIFAVWADQADWKDGRTRFAYWHPVAKSYSYYFEAIRVQGGFRFKEIAEPRDPDHFWDERLGDECPIRFYLPRPTKLPAVELPPSFSNPAVPGRPEKEPIAISPAIAKPGLDVPPPVPKQDR